MRLEDENEEGIPTDSHDRGRRGAVCAGHHAQQAAGEAGLDVLDAIKMRAAARTFVKKDVSVADLSAIVWAGNGQKGPDAVSGASKAGGPFPSPVT